MAIASDEELIVHDCGTCLLRLMCRAVSYGNEDSPCKEFIPTDWQDHIYSNGDWMINK